MLRILKTPAVSIERVFAIENHNFAIMDLPAFVLCKGHPLQYSAKFVGLSRVRRRFCRRRIVCWTRYPFSGRWP